ncbi:retrovirus-related Pol polyprotein from type-1 retrotransposable element R2, partial [Nephila pilipes]
DLLLLGQSPVDLQDNINSICGVAALAGLRFKPSKCASLSFNYTGNKRSIDDASFLVAGMRIRNIKGQEAYKYLGVRVGLSYKQDNTEFFQGITRDVKLVAASPLAPWQKLTAIRAHVLSRAEFLCRNSHIQKRDVADLDKTLISTGKRILNLPTRANVNLVHLSTNKGGAALPHFRALLDVHAISHAFRLLASDDQLTSDVAFAGLRGVVRKKILRDPTPSECAEFLNGNKAGDFARESGDLSTLWSRARQAADRLFKFIKFSWTFNEELGCFNLNIYRSPNPVCVVPSTAGLVARLLRDDLESFYIKQLSSLVDQGKTVEVFSQHPASNHFLQAGDFTRFCDWNFIHRARLGCLQLNATMRFSKRNPKCRNFSHPSGGDSTGPTGDSNLSSVPGVVGPVLPFLTKFQKDWSDRIKVVGSASELEEAYSQFILSIGGKPSRRRGRPRNPARRNTRRHLPSAEPAENSTSAAGSTPSAPSAGEPLTKRYDPVEASRLQKLFRANQKKALQSILSGPPRYCEISPDAVEDHFVRVFSENPFDPTFKFLTYDDPVASHLITDHMSPEEVWDKLRALKNSAPGPDGIFYSNFKSRDPGAHVLSAFFNKVLDLSTVPSSWKEAKVVLIPKPGDPLDISNWRPVSLLNTGGKVFSSVLAARISSWANINSRLSPFQKGFRENDGCSEHNFILEQAITGAKRHHLDLSMAWLDLENAFGSVPHRFILEALGHAGVPSSTVAIISAIYTGSTSTIRTSAGWTGPIPMRAGVRQGCPLSAILFNLSLEQILRTGISAPGFRLYGQEVKCLAYADDLLLLGQSPVDLQDNINSICGVAALAGLRFKPSKCASLSFNYTGNKRSIDDASFLVAGMRIRNIKGQEAYKYLGVRVGLSYKQDNTEFFQGITRDVKLVAASPLAPWQKLTAIRAHVLSRAEFLCRNSHIQKRDVADLDKTLISTGKRILNLPTRANVNLVHLSTNKGGAALPHFRALLDVHAISHAFRLLASDDQLTSDVAFAGLRGVVRKKILRDPTPSECAEFLNGNKAGDFARESGDLSTLWSRARQAADRLFKFIKFSWTFNEELGCFNLNIYRSPNPVCVVPSTAGLVARLLRDDLESFYIKQLSSLVDQ